MKNYGWLARIIRRQRRAVKSRWVKLRGLQGHKMRGEYWYLCANLTSVAKRLSTGKQLAV